MKKFIWVVSALILVFAVMFTACGKNTTFVDEDGKTHIAYTKKGVMQQDSHGNIIEVVERDGKTVTQPYAFPVLITNKSGTRAENGSLIINVPKHWELQGSKTKLIMYHSGECTDTGTPHCELNFRYTKLAYLKDIYDEYLGTVKYLVYYSGECSDLKEYETELFGHTVKAISYKFDKTNIYCYCYFIQTGYPVTEIEAYAYDKCYSEEDLIALLEENVTLKDLGGEIPEYPDTTDAADPETTTKASAQ